MGKKREKANKNIEELIEELIEARREALGDGNFPHCGFCPTNNSDDCYKCKNRYYENMRNELLKEYIVE